MRSLDGFRALRRGLARRRRLVSADGRSVFGRRLQLEPLEERALLSTFVNAFDQARPVQAGAQVLDEQAFTIPEIIDWNADGKLDLLVATWLQSNAPLQLYLNTGSDAWQLAAATPLASAIPDYAGGGESYHTVRCADLNGDGLFDLLVSNSQAIRLYANVGTAGNPQFTGYSFLQGHAGNLSIPSPWSFDVADWNGDGLQDLVAQDSGSMLFFGNDGTAGSPRFADPVNLQAAGQNIRLNGSPRPVVADLNGDNQPDLLSNDGDGRLWYYLNVGTSGAPVLAAGERFRSVHNDPLLAPLGGIGYWAGSRAAELQTADYNGDGVTDLLLGANHGQVLVYQGNAQGTDSLGPRVILWSTGHDTNPVEEIRVAFDEPINASTLQSGDVSVTGPAGPVPVGSVWWDSGQWQVVVRLSGPTWPAELQLSIGPDVRDKSGNLMDQDGNGTPGELSDAFVCTVSALPAYEKPWPLRTESGTLALSVGAGYSLADWDSDGDQDLLLGLRSGEVQRLRNDGGAGPYELRDPVPVLVSGSPLVIPGGATRPILVDLNGDGLKDLVDVELGGSWRWRCYLNSGTSASPAFTGFSYLAAAAGGDLRVNENLSRWYELSDWNGDGLADLLVGDFEGHIGWLANVGTSSLPLFAALRWMTDAYTHIGEPRFTRPCTWATRTAAGFIARRMRSRPCKRRWVWPAALRPMPGPIRGLWATPMARACCRRPMRS